MSNDINERFLEFCHQKLLVLMDYFHEICEKEGIDYSLAYGTMLGAVRHSGFIPWDDDADVFMMRSEYEKFLAAIKKYPRDDLYFKTDYHWIKKILFTDKPDFLGKKLVGDEIHLDIFIFDELPPKDKRKKFWLHLHTYQGMLNVEKIFGVGRPLKDKILMLATRIMGKFFRRRTLVKKYDKISQKYNGTGSGDFFNSNNSFLGIKRVFQKEWLAETQEVDFEGRRFRCFSMAHEILAHQFGDYMTPPPESERGGHIKLV